MVPLCLKPPAIKFNTHTLAPTAQSSGPVFSVPWRHYGNPLLFPCLTRTAGTITPAAVLSSVLLWAARKRYRSMAERSGIVEVAAEGRRKRKKIPFYGLERVCHSSSYPALRCVGNTVEPSRRRGAFPCRTAKKIATVSRGFSSKRGVNTARNAFSADHQRRAQRDHSVSTVISSLSYLSLTLQPGLL